MAAPAECTRAGLLRANSPLPPLPASFPALCPRAPYPEHFHPTHLFRTSGQRTGVDIYHQHIACPEFINLRRLRWRGGAGAGASSGSLSSVDEEPTPVLNLSFLIDHVMDSVHPLDWDAVLASPVPLKVGAAVGQ